MSLRISLMPFERRTIRNGTVNINAHEYHHGRLTLISDKVDLTAPLDERKYEVRYDPRNIEKVWLYDEEAQEYLELGFADMRKGAISLWEDRARRLRRGNPADQFKEDRYQSKLRREEMKEQAAKKTRKQRLEAEKEKRRATGALIQPPPPKPAPKSSGKKPLDATRLQALRDQVRPAAIDIVRKEKDHG